MGRLAGGAQGRVADIGRKHDDAPLVAAMAQGGCHFPAVEAGHGNIGQHQIRGKLQREVYALLPVFRRQHDEAEWRQHLAHEGAVVTIVVDDEDGPARPLIAAYQPVRGKGRSRAVERRQHQPHGEGAALARLARDVNGAAQRLCQKLGDGQPEAKTRRAVYRFTAAAAKGLEDALQILWRNAAARIGDAEGGDLRAVGNVQPDLALVRELDGIGQEIDEDLAQALFVGAHQRGQVRRAGELEAEPGGLRLQPHHGDNLVQKLVDVDRIRADLQAPGFDAGNVEQAVDEAGEMLGAAADDLNAGLAFARDGLVPLQHLRIAENRVERGAQFVAEADDIAALGVVRRFRRLLGALQGGVRLAVCLDLLQQQGVLAGGFLLRHPACVMGEHQKPDADAGGNGENDEDQRDDLPRRQVFLRAVHHGLIVDDGEDEADAGDDQHRCGEIAAKAGAELFHHPGGQGGGCDRFRLIGQPCLRLAAVAAAGIQRAAERADRHLIGRAIGHVLRLERVLADRAGDGGAGLPVAARLAGQIIFALRAPGDERGEDERQDKGDEGGQRRRRDAENAVMGEKRNQRRPAHGPCADRIDVIEMGTLELDARRGKAQRLVDEEIGGNRRQPGHGDDGEDAQRLLQQGIDAQFHQQERNADVEHQPDHPARMAVGEAGEEVGPGQRPGIGIHHVDLELRHHHEGGHQQDGGLFGRQHVAEGDRIHA